MLIPEEQQVLLSFLALEGVNCVGSLALFQLYQVILCHGKGFIVSVRTSTTKVLQLLPWAEQAVKSWLGRKKKLFLQLFVV